MKDITKLATILNADAILIDYRTKKTTYLSEMTDTDKLITNLLIQNMELLLTHTYQSLSYRSGHILTCRVDTQTVICFLFDYSDMFSSNNELIMINSLSNLQSISQVIYTLYTYKNAPEEDVVIRHLGENFSDVQNTQQTKNPQKFFDAETNIIKGIVHSDKEALIIALDDLSHVKIIGEHFASNNLIRGEKDTLISYLAVMNRAIIQWGYPVQLAFKLHNELVQEVELSHRFPDFFQVIREITWQYFKTVQEYRIHNFLPLHQRIHRYIDEHIGENITLDDLASALNTSKKNLNPAFKKEYNVTITQFIRHAKIDAAKELLIASDLNLDEITHLLSFSTKSYFVKTFKEITGVTPAYFRQHFFDQHLHL
ncbi:helix-turn-helix domain-containing protein [Leuconostoc fallax]|uniref:helix-turn-helix domain-containing protein n=1 Tax=Leuconostoc fallax TaxID=1251 RepID=UPI002090E02E|nr:helix-turn-helix domain-containing protein [Leuconostoc fallax]MCO6184475.1 helix-turn-helix domain-containing protein [Leuconostoc fallax]